jgi:hypothetical protein
MAPIESIAGYPAERARRAVEFGPRSARPLQGLRTDDTRSHGLRPPREQIGQEAFGRTRGAGVCVSS